jgi:hypothetical protein
VKDTGNPGQDAESDFARERRHRALAKVVSRLRAEPDDVSAMLPFEEVVAALGRRGERDLGLQVIALDRGRWQGIDAARRRGGAMPPIDVYRIGELHFVKDGHHRVSVARALGDTDIDAYVREVTTNVAIGRDLRLRDLPLKRHERVFRERVPLAPELRGRIELSDEWRYAQLATLVESWGLRAIYARGEILSREEIADAWFREEYEPLVAVLAEGDLGGEGTETERYLRIAMLRSLLLQTHDWTGDAIGRLLGEDRPPGVDDDTMVHQILKEIT